MKNFPPNIDPMTFTIIAAVVGALTTGDFDDYELNSIGNWIILIGQYLLTYAAQMQLIESRIDGDNINVNSKEYKHGGSPYINGSKSNQNQRNEVEYLLEAIKKIQIKLEQIEKSI